VFKRQVTDVTERIKTEVSKASEVVQAAIVISVTALIIAVVAVVAVVVGMRPRHA
jgi:hypothetical protein